MQQANVEVEPGSDSFILSRDLQKVGGLFHCPAEQPKKE
jgi:hypothetical protein